MNRILMQMVFLFGMTTLSLGTGCKDSALRTGSSKSQSSGNPNCPVYSPYNPNCTGEDDPFPPAEEEEEETPETSDSGDITVTAATISAGHICAIGNKQTYCWGGNSFYESGIEASGPLSSPHLLTGLANVQQFALGTAHSCALNASGGIQCWGGNTDFQLGYSSSEVSLSATPLAVPGLSSGVSKISSYHRHTCVVHNGAAKCWGLGTSGQLGHGATTSSATPVPSVGLTSGVTQVAAGETHTCAIKDGYAWCWGGNSSGQLGSDPQTTSKIATPFKYPAGFTITGNLTSGYSVQYSYLTISHLVAGANHTCAISSGNVYCWGNNLFGQVGNGLSGSANQRVQFPTAVQGLPGLVTQLVAGSGHTCALIHTGHVYCWGTNSWGQLGTSNFYSSALPIQVAGLSGVHALTAHSSSTCATLANGKLQCWGRNRNSIINDISGDRTPTPSEIEWPHSTQSPF